MAILQQLPPIVQQAVEMYVTARAQYLVATQSAPAPVQPGASRIPPQPEEVVDAPDAGLIDTPEPASVSEGRAVSMEEYRERLALRAGRVTEDVRVPTRGVTLEQVQHIVNATLEQFANTVLPRYLQSRMPETSPTAVAGASYPNGYDAYPPIAPSPRYPNSPFSRYIPPARRF